MIKKTKVATGLGFLMGIAFRVWIGGWGARFVYR